MHKTHLEKRNVSSAEAVTILKKNGIEVTQQEAALILDFIYPLAKMALTQFLEENHVEQISNQQPHAII